MPGSSRSMRLSPVALPNLMQVMWATVKRTSRSGKVMRAEERLAPIEVGKLADLVILDKNPLTVDPMTIN